jgi:hypothetical protein
MRSLLSNKRGSWQNWTEGASLLVLFTILFGSFAVYMNVQHDKDYQIEGLDTTNLEDGLRNKTVSLQEKVDKGTSGGGDGISGLSLTTSWDMVTLTYTLIVDYIIKGQFINTIVYYLRLPEIVATVLKAIIAITIILMLLATVFGRNKM